MRGPLIFAWLLCCAALAHAQPIVAVHGLSSIPPVNLLIAVGISAIGGLAWTSSKEANSKEENKKLAFTMFADILCSIVAGILAYFISASMTDSYMIHAACITVAGYGGTRFLEPMLTGAVERLKNVFAGNKV